MRYQAGIFDLLQYLFDATGYNDHQLHCVILFKDKVDAAVMGRAFRLLLDAAPALSHVYRDFGGDSYWQDAEPPKDSDLFTVVGSGADFDRFTCSKTDAASGPQIRGCLYRGERDALSVIVNHMVTDGAGMKELAYLLARIYSGIVRDPAYGPDFMLGGDRGYGPVLSGLRLRDKCRILFFHSGDNNESGGARFPFSGGGPAEPSINIHELRPDTYRDIIGCGKRHGATVNDVVLTAYLRALSALPELRGGALCAAVMIDMRRYLEDKGFGTLTNLSSTENIRFAVRPGEAFQETLARVSALMKAKKAGYFGLNSFIKLWTLFRLCGRRLAFGLLKKTLHHPYIGLTNIGVIDADRLNFEGCEIENAYITGSIKYRPHFQMSLTSFGDKMTLAVNLYGSAEDREKIENFFALIDRELEALR